MTRLYIIRHGETEWNREKRTQGCGNDLELSDIGLLQARAAAQKFKNIPVDAIYSSDLKRAFQTAGEISKAVSIEVNKNPNLREMNFGCWEGLTADEIKKQYKGIYEVWSSRPNDAVIPGAETLLELQKRVVSAIDDIISRHKGKNIVIVSHGITIKVLILSILCMDLTYHHRIRLDNTGISIIDFYETKAVLASLNDTCHLAGEVLR